jgi:hypothetical protein
MTAAAADRVQVIGAWTNLQGVRPAFAAGILSRSATPQSRLTHYLTISQIVAISSSFITL